MFNCWRLPLISAAVLVFSFSIGATSFLVKPEPVAAQQAQQAFPDVPPNYWARPFIQSLAEKGIGTGYPDRTFNEYFDAAVITSIIAAAAVYAC